MARVIAGTLAVVTGAARGIGRAVVEALLAEGVRVVAVDRDAEGLAALVSALSAPGRTVVPATLDVADPAAFAATVDDVIRRHGPIDLLVNNAGIMSVGPFLELPPEVDARQLAVNVGGVLAGMRAVLPGMLARRSGHVVNVASVAGRLGTPHVAVYSATKHAVVGLSEAVRHELSDTGVGVSCVLPGVVATELTAGVPRLRWPRTVAPEEVGRAVVRAWRTGAAEVYVPRAGRLAVVLPAVLPRALVERIGRLLGIDTMFARVDAGARAAYERRARG